jgi:hypothetical protein
MTVAALTERRRSTILSLDSDSPRHLPCHICSLPTWQGKGFCALEKRTDLRNLGGGVRRLYPLFRRAACAEDAARVDRGQHGGSRPFDHFDVQPTYGESFTDTYADTHSDTYSDTHADADADADAIGDSHRILHVEPDAF